MRISAANNILNISMIRAVTIGRDVATCQLSPAMYAAWELELRASAKSLAQEIEMDPEAIATFLNKGPQTVAGVPVLIDTAMPINVIRFLDPDGEVVGEIADLAIPIAFAHELSV